MSKTAITEPQLPTVQPHYKISSKYQAFLKYKKRPAIARKEGTQTMAMIQQHPTTEHATTVGQYSCLSQGCPALSAADYFRSLCKNRARPQTICPAVTTRDKTETAS
jgi:hypothetical protein